MHPQWQASLTSTGARPNGALTAVTPLLALVVIHRTNNSDTLDGFSSGPLLVVDRTNNSDNPDGFSSD